MVYERVLLSTKTKPIKRRSLFCTRFKCEGKCCDVIVDGESVDNVVLEEMVSKIKLKREKNPYPYQINWV